MSDNSINNMLDVGNIANKKSEKKGYKYMIYYKSFTSNETHMEFTNDLTVEDGMVRFMAKGNVYIHVPVANAEIYEDPKQQLGIML